MNNIRAKILATSLLLLLSLGHGEKACAGRLKDLANVKGVRDNQLIGYGLIVGLNGTGDGSNSAFTTRGLVSMLTNMGVKVNESDIKVKNVAGVIVTAKLAPFMKTGQTMDITISSLGDAASLQGGTLLTTPLKGLDGKVYAIAQGPVSIGGFEVSGNTAATGGQKNHLNVGRIPNGATVEKEVPSLFADQDKITLSLNAPDFTTVTRMVAAINKYLGRPAAAAQDGATVNIAVPEGYRQNTVSLLAALENLEITPDSTAKVVLDERTGTIVIGENVRIDTLAISHGAMSIQVSPEQPPPILTKEMVGQTITPEMVKEEKTALDKAAIAPRETNRLLTLTPGVSLGELVKALNAVGVTPRDLIAIFQAIKASGALQAELEII